MDKVKTFNDFLTDLLLEGIDQGELPFKLSERLIGLLHKINHKITDRLLEDDHSDRSSKFTLIDYDNDDVDMFTFATSAKILDNIKVKTVSQDQETNLDMFYDRISYKQSKIWGENRAKIKIGKFINKLYPNTYINAGKPGEDIESFVNSIKAERTKTLGNFKIVEGQDVVKYYYKENYEKGGEGSPLWSSCMAGKVCQPYIGFYPHNNVKLVVLMSSEGDTIRGRALLWDIDEIDGKDVKRKFMDRIYVIKQHDIQKFISLAEKNEWLHKKNQDMWDTTEIVDTKDGSSKPRTMIKYGVKEYKSYPYMDTMKYFNNEENFLTNNRDSDSNWSLESADGGYFDNYAEMVYDSESEGLVNSNDLIWSDEEERYLNPDDCVHSQYADKWASQEYAEEHWIHSDPEDDWIPKDDAIYIKSINGYVSDTYADDNYSHCEFDDEWYDSDRSVPSNMWGCVPDDKIIVVIESENIDLDAYDESSLKDLDLDDEIDVRYRGDKTYFTVSCEKENKTYHLDNKLKGSKFVKQIKKGVY